MARVKTVWGIDIGQCALKAIKLADFEEVVEVVDFEIIEHPEILSQPDVDKPLLIRQSLEQFLSAHETRGSTIVLSVPGQSSFTRFFKPPPVDAKELPRIVQYEAAQQIPFPVDEVIWRWQASIISGMSKAVSVRARRSSGAKFRPMPQPKSSINRSRAYFGKSVNASD